MKKHCMAIILIGFTVIWVAVAGQAWAYVFAMGPGSNIDTAGTSNALTLYVEMASLDGFTFDLDVGESETFKFATIGTHESWINADDRIPAPVTAQIDFDIPDFFQPIGGTSIGFSALWHFIQGWNLDWEDPIRIVTSSGLDFSVGLNDVSYLNWFWQGPDGSADIYATVTLNAVPVPMTLLLLGSGLVGLIGMRRRSHR